MQNFAINVKRLRRHYEHAVQTYDDVSLADLWHALRMWADIKPLLARENPSFSTSISFKTALPQKKLTATFRGRKYVYAAFPGGVITHAANGNLMSGAIEKLENELTVNTRLKLINDTRTIEATHYCAVAKELDDAESNAFNKAIANAAIKRCNYAQWLASESMRVGYVGESSKIELLSISREVLMRRVSNEIGGGSHPIGGQYPESFSDREKTKRVDEAIRNSMQYKIADLPIPYFVLLKIAQDILAVAERKDGIEI